MTANRKRARYFPDIEEILASIPQSPELSAARFPALTAEPCSHHESGRTLGATGGLRGLSAGLAELGICCIQGVAGCTGDSTKDWRPISIAVAMATMTWRVVLLPMMTMVVATVASAMAAK
ncbi:hypothetical protein AEP_02641 [Curvibacter sp. AEP1-3]|nr:hypothetical protein AEP_02641 [Curvibacter sp. AEP1-3]